MYESAYSKLHHFIEETSQVKLTLVLPAKQAQRRRTDPVLIVTSSQFGNTLDIYGASEIHAFKRKLDALCKILKEKLEA